MSKEHILLAAIVDEAQAIQAKAEAERRDLTKAEFDEINRLCDEFDRISPPPGAKPDASYFAKLKLKLSAAGSGRR